MMSAGRALEVITQHIHASTACRFAVCRILDNCLNHFRTFERCEVDSWVRCHCNTPAATATAAAAAATAAAAAAIRDCKGHPVQLVIFATCSTVHNKHDT